MRRTDICFLLLAALCLVSGMALGVAMGLARDFSLRPVHAHLNLLGWATLALYGLAYRAWPDLTPPPLARLHLLLSGGGAVLMPAGIWIVIARGPSWPAWTGALLSLMGALVFATGLLRLLLRPAPASRAAGTSAADRSAAVADGA